jgi:hypothetical protein
MMNTVLAVFGDMGTAKNVIETLNKEGFKRADIGLAANPDAIQGEDKVLVTCTVKDHGGTELAKDVMNRHSPRRLDVRNAQWRLEKEEKGNFLPDADKFKAVDLFRIDDLKDV